MSEKIFIIYNNKYFRLYLIEIINKMQGIRPMSFSEFVRCTREMINLIDNLIKCIRDLIYRNSKLFNALTVSNIDKQINNIIKGFDNEYNDYETLSETNDLNKFALKYEALLIYHRKMSSLNKEVVEYNNDGLNEKTMKFSFLQLNKQTTQKSSWKIKIPQRFRKTAGDFCWNLFKNLIGYN